MDNTEIIKPKHPGGRPRKYQDPIAFSNLVEQYFIDCDNQKEIITDDKGKTKTILKPYTITGLALFLDMTREMLIQYEQLDEFKDIIKKAKLRVEKSIEERILTGQYVPVSGIFNLKNNFGWQDKQEINQTVNAKIQAVPFDPSVYTRDELDQIERLLDKQNQGKSPS